MAHSRTPPVSMGVLDDIAGIRGTIER